MAIDSGFLAGYAGHARMAASSAYRNGNAVTGGVPFNLTSGSYARQFDIPQASSFNVPQDDTGVRGPIRLGYGVYSYSGSMSFELTSDFLSAMWNDMAFRRYSLFDVDINDGESSLAASNCVWSNITVQGGVGSLPSCSISFQSNNGFEEPLSIVPGPSPMMAEAYGNDGGLIPYWQSGPADFSAGDVVTEFSVSFDRQVSPVYLNNDLKVPSYLKAGLITVSAQVSCANVARIVSDGSISIYISSNMGVRLNYGELSNHSYSITDLSSAGIKTYSFNSISQTSPNDAVFTILREESNLKRE